MRFAGLLLTLFLIPSFATPNSACDKLLQQLYTKLKESPHPRASLDEVAPELKPIIKKIINSGTRTRKQEEQLAEAVIDYLAKNGAKARIQNGAGNGMNIVIERISKDSPFAWAKNVPERLTERFNKPIMGIFNTDIILNPYTPGMSGGIAEFRPYFANGSSALVYSAKSLMTKRFQAPSDGHEAIHAKAYAGDTPQLVIDRGIYRQKGNLGAELYGSEFASEEIHSTYPFSIRTELKNIEPGNPKPIENSGALTWKELILLRNGILQGLYQSSIPAYEAALKPGAIKKKLIREFSNFGGDRYVEIQTDDNSFGFSFQSEQVNRWKLLQNPKASKDMDWSKDPGTIQEMIRQDYLASQTVSKEIDWLVTNLVTPDAKFDSFRQASQRVTQLRDFTTLGNPESSRQEMEQAALRVVEQGSSGDKPDIETKTNLVKKVLQMAEKSQASGKSKNASIFSVQKPDGSWLSIDANHPTQESPAVKLMKLLQP